MPQYIDYIIEIWYTALKGVVSMADEKAFLTHNQQMKHLRESKKIDCRGSKHKEILCRTGYFNLVNGYKGPFVSHMVDGNHIYYPGTSINEIFELKKFDDELRSILLKYLTKVEEEVRTVTAYKFDEVNDSGKTTWYQIEAYDTTRNIADVVRVISHAYGDIDHSTQEYVKYYLENHQFIPTWIMAKVIRFSTFIDFLDLCKPDVKQAICTLYGILKPNGDCYFRLLKGSLHWFRTVRNSCAHNERIYTMKHSGSRLRTTYMNALAKSYSREADKKVIDLLVYLKFYLPHTEYAELVLKIGAMLLNLKGQIRPQAFEKVRADLGIKDVNHLDKLLENPKHIKYNDLGKL